MVAEGESYTIWYRDGNDRCYCYPGRCRYHTRCLSLITFAGVSLGGRCFFIFEFFYCSALMVDVSLFLLWVLRLRRLLRHTHFFFISYHVGRVVFKIRNFFRHLTFLYSGLIPPLKTNVISSYPRLHYLVYLCFTCFSCRVRGRTE